MYFELNDMWIDRSIFYLYIGTYIKNRTYLYWYYMGSLLIKIMVIAYNFLTI